jgi:uncharacterized protein YbjT (DUF2867 family)
MATQTPRVLVAGATGYLGSFVLRELKARGHFVRALVRSPEKLADLRDELDEIAAGAVTQPATLTGCCHGIDVVFSSVGITRQQGKLTWKDVDYQGNLNLLAEARRAGVRKFVYVSAIDGPKLTHLDIVKAHEDFVAALAASGLEYTVLRPTGYFSDLAEIYQMARKGRVYLFGDGKSRINPIHGADLAVACADALDDERRAIDVGGPETLTWREVAALAFEVQGKRVKISTVPLWIMTLVIFVTRLFSRHKAELLAFFTTMGTRDVLGPSTGTHTLAEHYRKMEAAR